MATPQIVHSLIFTKSLLMFIRYLFLALIALGLYTCRTNDPAASATAPPAFTTGQPLTVFQNVNVLPMSGNAPVLLQEGQTVVVEGDKIAYVGTAQFKLPAGTTVIDGTGKFLLPGLAEMHAHIPVPQEGDTTLVKETLFLYLSNGITTIRGMLGQPYHLNLKDQVARREILGPRIYTSSPSLNGNTVRTPEEGRQKVEQYARDGYDFLKIHPGIQLPVMEEVVRTARRVDIPFAGHVPIAVGIERALDFRYATIDHIDGYVEGLVPPAANVRADSNGTFGYNFTHLADPARIPALVRQTREAGVAIVPTQSLLVRWMSPESGAEMAAQPEMAYIPGSMRYQWRQAKDRMIGDAGYTEAQARRFIDLRQQLLREMDRQGVVLLLGSDAPQIFNVPGFSIQHEMQAMADAGVRLPTILKAGTMNVAAFFGQEGDYGAVRSGAAADLLLLDANPLQDIRHMQKIAGVMAGGKWLSRAEIDRRLAEMANKYQ